MASAAADGAAAGSGVPDARRAVAGGKPERRWDTGRRRRAGMGGGCQAGETAGDWRAGAAVRRCRSDFFDLALGFLSCSQPQKLSTEHGMTGRDQDSLLLSHLTTRILVCWIEIAQWPPRRQLKHPFGNILLFLNVTLSPKGRYTTHNGLDGPISLLQIIRH
jgi:hypothetical protein